MNTHRSITHQAPIKRYCGNAAKVTNGNLKLKRVLKGEIIAHIALDGLQRQERHYLKYFHL